MYSLTTQEHKSSLNQGVNFHNKQQLVCSKACNYVAEWLADNNKNCNELLFDRNMISFEKDYFRYTIRAVEQYLRRAYCFEVICNKNKIQISYVQTSQNPQDLIPGDFKVKLRPSW